MARCGIGISVLIWRSRFQIMSDENKSNDDEKTPKKGGEFRVPPRTWIVWIAIFGGIIMLMLMRDKWETQGEPLPQWKFMQLYDSNLIAQAVVNYNPQNPLLTEIVGKYILADKDGKVINAENGRPKEVAFRTQAARLT